MSTRDTNQLNPRYRTDEKQLFKGTDGQDDITGTDGRDEIYLGEGADIVFGGEGGDTIDLGSDLDPDMAWYKNFSERTDIIENFDPNDEDIVVLTSGFFWDLVHNEGLNSDANVREWLKIEKDGADTKIKVDPDGIQGDKPIRTLAILKNVDPNDIAYLDANDIPIPIDANDFIIG
ncbi:hypothetical protein BJP36_27595 [Moorena producens JHB]|uniref:Peptidase M10 serralysin C-terminal domain-containing protein n=1 Tax=Moorena producens (strain JHB) TaxID=1454205 RepID=A0A1D9G684_MOOP1|nr:hypothetical protein [Moorena producens]AOY83126.1 hypothetical protein BJP36_27595 [Moorena producens JHB]